MDRKIRRVRIEKSPRERLQERYELMLRPSFKEELSGFSRDADIEMARVMRDGAEMFMRGRLPVLGRIPCGPLQEAIAETPYFEIVPPMLRPRADLGDYLLEASGDSMEPDIKSGDLVMLRPNIEWGEGEICAVQVFHDKGQEGDCDATLKRVFLERAKGKVTLKSINPEFKPMVVDAEYVRVVGVFRGLLRQDG
jgi:SOS-response transcriptional repressor LexA